MKVEVKGEREESISGFPSRTKNLRDTRHPLPCPGPDLTASALAGWEVRMVKDPDSVTLYAGGRLGALFPPGQVLSWFWRGHCGEVPSLRGLAGGSWR